MADKAGPLDQFKIMAFGGLPNGHYQLTTFTNSSLLMLITVALITALMVLGSAGGRLVPGRVQSVAELLYEFIDDLVLQTVGPEGKPYFGFLFSLFMFILVGNLVGMVPFSFTFTSHIIVTFALAAVVFIGVTIIGLVKHGFHFFTLFAPAGVPWPMLLILVPLEILSYFIRPFTLSIRLFANMMAGHTMLIIFGGFVGVLGLAGIAPLGMDLFLIVLELLVAVLQAYVFTILSCLYLKDAIHLH